MRHKYKSKKINLRGTGAKVMVSGLVQTTIKSFCPDQDFSPKPTKREPSPRNTVAGLTNRDGSHLQSYGKIKRLPVPSYFVGGW